MNSRQLANQWPHVRYKHFQKAMREAAAQWFVKEGMSVSKKARYILADRDNWAKNIILPEVVKYIENEIQVRPSFPLHKYIHHGLSSQAMVFNLIAPLIVRDDLEILIALLNTEQSGKVTAEFEYEDRAIFNEDSGQPTSIDLLIRINTTPRYFIESKFTESEFGGCSIFSQGDCDGRNPVHDFDLCYLHFIGRRYWKLMTKHGFLTPRMKQNMVCVFSTYYQFFREILFAIESGGTFVLLYDARNPTFYNEANGIRRGLLPFLLTFIPQQHQKSVVGITIQQVIDTIKKTNQHDWIIEFEHKYGLK